MALEQRLKNVEAELEKVGSSVEKLSHESKSTLKQDQKTIELQLRITVKAIQGAQAQLLIGAAPSPVRLGAFSSGEDASPPALVARNFSKLQSCASQSYENVAEHYRNAHDLHGDLEAIQKRIGDMTRKGKDSIREAGDAIRARETEKDDAEANMRECKREKAAIAGKAEDNRDVRIGLRVGRAVAWGATLAIPALGVVAAGLEVGAQLVSCPVRPTRYSC
jgi:hypothetical protein